MPAKDSTLNRHDGTYDPSVVFNQDSPVGDGLKAVAFSGTGVTIPHAVDWFSSSFTMESWISINDPAGDFHWHVGTTGPQLDVTLSDITIRIPNNAAGTWATVSAGVAPGQNEPAYICAVCDVTNPAASTLSIYLDGNLYFALDISNGSGNTTGVRAQDDGTSTSVLSGANATTVAHCAWYDKPILEARVASHASIGSNGRFNPGGGTTGGGSSGGTGAPLFTNNPPLDGSVGQTYAFQFQASGDTPLSFTKVNGFLPDGLTLGLDGFLSGIPTVDGTFTYTIQVQNPNGIAQVQYTTIIGTGGAGQGGGSGSGNPTALDALHFGISGAAHYFDGAWPLAAYLSDLDHAVDLGCTVWRDDVGTSPTAASDIGTACHDRGLLFIACINVSPAPNDAAAIAGAGAIAAACSAATGDGTVDGYECLNEADLHGHATGDTYYTVAKGMCDAILAQDPNAYVIAGTKSNNTAGPEVWFGQMYTQAGTTMRDAGFSALSYHSYEVSWPSDTTNSGGRKPLHDLMVAQGDSGMMIHITETGSQAAETAQATAITNIINAARNTYSAYVACTCIYTLRPDSSGPWNILNSNGSERASYTAMKNAIAQFTVPQITAATPPAGVQSTTYLYHFVASGTAPITWSVTAGSLPTGLTLASNGTLSGTPTGGTGTSTFTVQAANSGGSDTASVSLTINASGGGGGGAGNRDARWWPFAWNSPWNMPLGDGITFDGAISAGYYSGMTCGGNYVNGYGRSVWNSGYSGESNLNQASSSPVMEGHYSIIGQAPGHVGDPHWDADYYQHDHPSAPAFTVISVDLQGNGINTQTMQWTGGSGAWGHVNVFGSPNIAGLVRVYDLDQGEITHVLCCTLPGALLKVGWVWPASAQDGNTSDYTGLTPMGSLLAIPPGTTKPSLSALGSMVWDAMTNYGVYVTDRGGTGPALEVEANVGNYAGWQTFATTELANTISPHLRRVSNNSQANVGGPGARLAPFAPTAFL